MKHNGALMEYADERMKDLMRVYDEYISSCDYIRMPEVYSKIVNMQSSRFWVSDIRAIQVIYAMMRGSTLKEMRPLKREMFEEIFKRVMDMKNKHPDMSIRDCCTSVISRPAPKFYLTPGSAKIMVCKARKKWVQGKLKRLRLL